MILTTVPAVAGTVATATGEVPFEWSAAILVLVGLSVLISLAANSVKIWKDTRPVPAIGEQIQNAIDRHESAAKDRQAEQCKQLDDNFGRIEKRLDGHDEQLRELWRASPYTARKPG